MDEIPEDELRRYVREFLEEFKALVHENGLIVQNRQKNRDHLLQLGLTARQREGIVLDLSVADYSSGPTEDEYRPGQYWVFGKRLGGVEVYIKLKIAGPPEAEHPVCFSFHEAEHPLSYPLAGE